MAYKHRQISKCRGCTGGVLKTYILKNVNPKSLLFPLLEDENNKDKRLICRRCTGSIFKNVSSKRLLFPSLKDVKIKDKRLLYSSRIEQPPFFKFGKPSLDNFTKVKIASSKVDVIESYNTYRGDVEGSCVREVGSVVLASQLSDCYSPHKYWCNSKENSEKKLIENLQIALVEQYNSNLQEQERKKDIVKKHGLFNRKGTATWLSRLETSIGKIQTKRIIRLSPLTSFEELESLTTSFELINEKRAEVNKLTFYRTQRGISHKWDLTIFEDQKIKRQQNGEIFDVRNIALPVSVKRKKPEIDIFHLPRFKDLSPKESELCCKIGLEPAFYLDVKDFLISDCKKNEGLLLKRARKLIKIDVNKTRKIFDFLLEEGFIWLPGAGHGAY
ncbi:transcriptional adapter 2-alpha-like isoform X1 [Macrosteles quadrilineatus]|uniref:transcriptional adapter 2-alpha-like isoform X1 n=1 Tax=Macrosteles quadrilineatus TaxID=74068 RepID=UPI0023E1C579|nr:transcriptional adapter 2-alpha-like isoform X1 [Macrosteles quadrilineatus]XP_054281071.1 transcriptional adapter 2-alpha-like isoform X1 [Macrosteles quadrilineatus]